MVPKSSEKGQQELEISRRNKTIQIIALLRLAKILKRIQETWEKLVVTQTPVKDHKLTLVWKTHKE